MEKIYLWVDDGEQSVKAQELLHKLGYNPICKGHVQPCGNTRHYIRCESDGGIYYGSSERILNKRCMGYREVTLSELESMVKEKKMSKLRTKEDYRKMKPTDTVDVVVDGHKFEVELKNLVLLTDVIGNSLVNLVLLTDVIGNSLVNPLDSVWAHLHKIFGTRPSEKSDYNLEKLVDDASGYFIPEETIKKLNEIEFLNETIKELQIKVNSLKESL